MTAVTNRPSTVLAVDCDVDDTDDLSQVNHALIDVPFAGQESSYLLDPIPDTIKIYGAGAGYEVTVRADMRDNLTGYMICWGDDSAGGGGTIDFAITQSSGTVQIIVNGTTHSVPNYTVSSTLFDMTISVNGRPNPFTTGASDAIVADVYMWDHTAGDVTVRQITHSEIVHTSGNSFAIGGRIVDAATDYLSGTWGPGRYADSVRVGKQAITLAQFLDDYSLRTAPTASTGTNFDAMQALPETTDRIVSDDAVAGPVYQMAGHNVKHAARRGVSPIVYMLDLDREWQGSLYAIETIAGTDNNKLECQGTPAVTDGVSGASEPAFRMDSGGFLGTNFVSSLTSDYSMSAWVRVPSLPGAGLTETICGHTAKTTATQSNRYGQIYVDENGALHHQSQAGTPGSATSYTVSTGNSVITANTWHHIAIVAEDLGATERVKIYVDGTEEADSTVTQGDNNSAAFFCVGGTYDGTTFADQSVDIAALHYCSGLYSTQLIDFEARQGQAALWRPTSGVTAWTSLYLWDLRKNSAGFVPQKDFMPYTETEGTVHLSLAHSFKRAVSPKVSHCKVVIYYSTRDAIGSTYSNDQKIRVYSQSAAPGKLYFPPKTIETYSVVSSSLSEVTNSVLVLDGLKIARNENGESWFTLGFNSDAARSQIQISGLEIHPYSKETTSSNPLPFALP